MRIYLLRHAQADSSEPDPKRALTRRGRQDVELLGGLLKDRSQFKPDRIWHSPYVRASQTAQLLVKHCQFEGPVESHEGLTPYDDPTVTMAELSGVDESIAVVGHNPHLSMLAGRMLGTDEFTVAIEFKKCSIICLERNDPLNPELPPMWVLRWMIVPQLLR